jgi:hypothetical protein
MRLQSMSRNASDLFKIAVTVAGFNAGKLMLEIHRLQRDHSRLINSRTVERAMQNLWEIEHAKSI